MGGEDYSSQKGVALWCLGVASNNSEVAHWDFHFTKNNYPLVSFGPTRPRPTQYLKLHYDQLFSYPSQFTIHKSIKISRFAFHMTATINITIFLHVTPCEGRDSIVGIATRYGHDGPGIESRCGRDFPHPSRPVLGGQSNQLFNWNRVAYPGFK